MPLFGAHIVHKAPTFATGKTTSETKKAIHLHLHRRLVPYKNIYETIKHIKPEKHLFVRKASSNVLDKFSFDPMLAEVWNWID